MKHSLGENLRVSWIFFLVRFAASLLIGLIYILLAAAIQYFYVSLFGESKFNYIIGGIFSLVLGAVASGALGSVVFMFVRGWHIAALAFADQIVARDLPPIEAGMAVFKKHFGSFAVIYGAKALVQRLASRGIAYLGQLLKDVPVLCNLERWGSNPLVAKIARDILETSFDAALFYIMKYTRPGLGDDVKALPDALRRYLYAIPSVFGASVTSYLCFYFIPRILKIATFVLLIYTGGFVAGILQCVLVYPVFYILQHAVFDLLECLLLVNAYSKHCTEEPAEDSVYASVVDHLMETVGLDKVFDDDAPDEGGCVTEEKDEEFTAESEEDEQEEEEDEEDSTQTPALTRAQLVNELTGAKPNFALQAVMQQPAPDTSDVGELPLSDNIGDETDPAPEVRRVPTTLQDIVNIYATTNGIPQSSVFSTCNNSEFEGSNDESSEDWEGGAYPLGGASDEDFM